MGRNNNQRYVNPVPVQQPNLQHPLQQQQPGQQQHPQQQLQQHQLLQQQLYGQPSGQLQRQQPMHQLQPGQQRLNGGNPPTNGQMRGGNVRQPGFLQTPPRQAGFSNLKAASLSIALNEYTNQGLKMENGMTCTCNPPTQCTFLKNIPNPCYFSFTIIVSAKDQSVHYISKDFVPMNISGQMDPTQGDWTTTAVIEMASKPMSIDIFVHNLGPVIQGTSALYFDYLWPVDTFVIDLRDYVPTAQGQAENPVSNRYTGLRVGSILTVTYKVSCLSGYMGPSCDMQCTSGGNFGADTNKQVICSSTIGNTSAICEYSDGTRSQVTKCITCPYGVSNHTCVNLGVSWAYRTWTIVLGCLLGIALIFIILLVVLKIASDRKRKQEQERYARSARGASYISSPYDNNAPNSVTNPLLSGNDEWAKPPAPPTAVRRAHQPVAVTDAETSRTTDSDTRNGHGPYQPRREAQV
ncbi:Protein F14B8.5 b [Aphelenchoides avenae]|nr:Protein F14B8.5 b [Aphelenchus avenae]